MKEIKDIINAYDEAQQQGRQTALATVVHVDGSSYRRPGARMLVTDQGMLTGAISGGCLEGDALRKAMLVLNQRKTMLVTYDTMDEDDAKLGVGLGCNGIIQVLIEPVDAANPDNPVELLRALSAKRQNAVLITLFSLQNRKEEQPGTCLLWKEDKMTATLDASDVFRNVLEQDAKKAMSAQTSSFKNYIADKKSITAFVEYLRPPVSLIIIGAGNDVKPMVDMAAILGWETTVVDGRRNYASAERFMSACQVIVARPENVLQQLQPDDQTVFLLMTHNYNYDLAMLRALLKTEYRYIGSLGPKTKLERMLAELRAEGTTISPEQLKNIYGPSGLDIGAETPEEIALSILAEIKAVLSGRQGQQLREHNDSIHPRVETFIEKISITK